MKLEFLCLYVCMYVCMYVCVCIYIYIYIYRPTAQGAGGWLVRRGSGSSPGQSMWDLSHWGRVVSRLFRFSPFIIIPSLFHILLHPQHSSCREAKRTKPDNLATMSWRFRNRGASWRKSTFIAFTKAYVLHRYCNLDKICYVMLCILNCNVVLFISSHVMNIELGRTNNPALRCL